MKHTKTRKVMVQGFEWEYTPYYLNGTPYVCMSEITQLYTDYGNDKIWYHMYESDIRHSVQQDVSNIGDFVKLEDLHVHTSFWGGDSNLYSSPILLNPHSDEHISYCESDAWVAYCEYLRHIGMVEFTHNGVTKPLEYLPYTVMIVEDYLERYLEETPSELSTLGVSSDEYILKQEIKSMKKEISFLRELCYELRNKINKGGY